MTEAEAAIGRERISSCLSTNSFLGFVDWVRSPEVQAYPKEKKKNPTEVIKKNKTPQSKQLSDFAECFEGACLELMPLTEESNHSSSFPRVHKVLSSIHRLWGGRGEVPGPARAGGRELSGPVPDPSGRPRGDSSDLPVPSRCVSVCIWQRRRKRRERK